METVSRPSISLLDLLSISVVFDDLIPYLPLQSIARLSTVSRAYRDFVFSTPKVFRYLDLSKCRGAYIGHQITPIDVGGNRWRAERMDENLTEDEFYSGPLRGVLARLAKRKLLQDVQVLVLDGLAAVSNDFISDIATSHEYNVKLLSIRNCVNVNEPRLQQFLRYICRPGRPEGTPRLQGIYFFTDPSRTNRETSHSIGSGGVMSMDGATLGVIPTDKSRNAVDSDLWYAPSGHIVSYGDRIRTAWEETLMCCQGIIAFDAVLCTHMHRAMSSVWHEASRDFLNSNKPGIQTIATVALGPEGCSGCGAAPAGSPIWGQNHSFDFPLLWPPPYSGRVADAVRPPRLRQGNPHIPCDGSTQRHRLIASCTWCLANRHCDSCHRWWCADCYNPKQSQKLADLEDLSNAGVGSYLPSREELTVDSLEGPNTSTSYGDSVKVFNGLCVENCLVSEMMSGAGSFGMWA